VIGSQTARGIVSVALVVAVCRIVWGAPAGRALYEEGVRHYENCEFQKAIDCYEAFIRENPGHEMAPHAQMEIAILHRHLNQPDKSIHAYREVVDTYPDVHLYASAALLKIGDIHYSLGRNRQALDAYQQVLDGFPDCRGCNRALYMRGYIFLFCSTEDGAEKTRRQDRLRKGLAEWESLFRRNPDKGTAQHSYVFVARKKIGDVYFELKEYDKALQSFSRWCAVEPTEKKVQNYLPWTYPHACFMMGEICRVKGQKDKALAAYEKAAAAYQFFKRWGERNRKDMTGFADWFGHPTLEKSRDRIRELRGE